MKQYIYADNAATTKLDKAAFESMIPWLLEEYGMLHSHMHLHANRKKPLQTQELPLQNV